MEDINSALATAQGMQDGLFGRDAPTLSVSDWLKQQAEPEKPPVSLKTLKKNEVEKIMSAVQKGISAAKNYYQAVVEPELIRRDEVRNANEALYRKKFPNLSDKSKFVSMDLNNTVEWIKPSLVEVFTGNESPITIAGSTVQNDDRATRLQQLIEYQLTRKNNYTTMVHDVVDDALSLNFGVSKVWWRREEQRERYKMLLDIRDMQSAMMLTQATLTGEIEIQSIKELDGAPDLYDVRFDHVKVVANYPVVEHIPPTELRFTPEARTLQECKFVAHRKIVKGDYLKRKEQDGTYQNVTQALEETGDTNFTDADTYINPQLNENGMRVTDGDDASKDVELYESYIDVDYNNDGVYEHLIVHSVGNTPLSIQTNEFDIAPFFAMGGKRQSSRIFADRGLAEEIEGLQDLKTALIKQVVINVGKNNDQQKFINVQQIQDVDALLNGDEYVPVSGDPNSMIYNPPQANISPLTMDLVNYAESEIENRSGSTKYNQGLDSNSLNKMLDINIPVPMADGSYKLLKDIVDGDRIIGRNGSPTVVLKAHAIHYPEKAYNITFQSGEVIKAGGEHLWTVKTQTGDWKTINTDAMYQYMRTHGGNLYIPRVGHVNFDGCSSLPLDPYILGYYLGNGHRHSCRITTPDIEVVERFSQWCEEHDGDIKPCKTGQNSGEAVTYTITGGLWNILKELQIVKRGGDDWEAIKYIPDCYFKASYTNRLELLRGLMDADGCHHSGALCVFSQVEGRLLDDVIKLIKSLGMWPTKHYVDPGSGGFDTRKLHYNIHFSANDNPFCVSRKSKKWRQRTRCVDKQKIVSILPTDVCLMRCLTVDAKDGLFCVGKLFTVTHNTATGITAILGQADKRIKLVARLLAENWIVPMTRFVILLNKKYGEPVQTFRFKDMDVSISSEDMDIDYDLIINVGNGAGTKEARIQSYMLLLSQVYPVLSQAGVATPKSYYAAGTALLEEMGLKNTQGILLDPDSQEAQAMQAQQAQQAVQQAQAAQQAQLHTELALKQADYAGKAAVASIPRISANIKDLPVDAQLDIINNGTSGKTTPEAIAQREVLNHV